MTGPEHYKEAEKYLAQATDGPTVDVMLDVAVAQVHATLALAAATAYPVVKEYCGDETTEPRDWTWVTS